jgi:tetratricopeptide (TPR) repeat protein
MQFRTRALATGLMLLAVCQIGFAQLQAGIEMIKTGKMRDARNLLSEAVKSEPSPDAWHALGIVELALGDASAAEETFSKEIELVKGEKASASGLEEFASVGTTLHRGLRLQKTAVQLGNGEAAAYNNRGAARILLARWEEASADIDKASTLDTGFGHPWLNGALIALGQDDAALAEKNVRVAVTLGQKNALAQAVLAEALYKLGRLERAEDAYKEAFRFDVSHPYALLIKSKIDLAQGRLREAERAYVQALSAGPQVAVDSKLTRHFAEGNALGGSASDLHANLLDHSFSSSSGATRIQGSFDQQLVEDRSNGKQRTTQLELTHASRIGTIHGLHVNWNGGRPGSVTSIADLDPAPDNRFRFSQTTAMLLEPIAFNPQSTLWLHSNLRTARMHVKATDADPTLESLNDTQWMHEFRWDLNLARESILHFGATYSKLERSGAGPRPVQPSEQVLANGITHMYTAYMVNRRALSSAIDLTWGVMTGGAAKNEQVQPLLDLGFRTPSARTVHLRVTPRFNDSVSNLIPIDTVADNPQTNPLDRTQFSTSDFNRSPTLQGSRSKLVDFELALTTGDSPSWKSETTLFHRKLDDVNAQGADSRLSTTLVLTPVQDAQATGIEHRITKVLSDPFTLRFLFRYQETDADFTNTTYDLAQYPVLVEMSGNRMPNFPRYQGVASLDYANGPWNASLIGVYFGNRTTAVTRTIAGSPRTFLSKAKAGTNAHVVVQRKLQRQATAVLEVFNIGNANFYPGYPGKTTYALGLNYRF